MKSIFLATTVLTGMIASSGPEATIAANDAPTHETVMTTTVAPTEQDLVQQQIAAESLIDHVNDARLSLALNNKGEATKEIAKARQQAKVLDASGTEYKTKTEVQAGRFTYEYNHATRDHYFPLGGGMVERKEFDTGPFWAKKEGVAVKNAEIAYISINIDTKKTNEKLADADAALKENDQEKAADALDDILNDSIKAEKVETLPLVKAQDNLTLAKSFLQARNYDGARFALKHAEDGIDAMKSDDRYNVHDDRIAALHTEVQQMQDTLAKNDPTMLEKAKAQMTAWWNELRDWSDEKQKTM